MSNTIEQKSLPGFGVPNGQSIVDVYESFYVPSPEPRTLEANPHTRTPVRDLATILEDYEDLKSNFRR